MIHQGTMSRLADLRAQIDRTYESCGQTVDAVTTARRQNMQAEAFAPFLSDCAQDLDNLADLIRVAASHAALQAPETPR